MIITCPHCQTKYQVTFETIGSAGRKVQCAHCHKAWNQDPTPPEDPSQGAADKLFDAMAEDAMDEAMAAEASAVAAAKGGMPPRPAPEKAMPGAIPGPDAAELKKRQLAFLRRQNAMSSSLPLARLRRAARVVGAVLLVGIFAGGYFGRVQIVERYPDLAGIYEAVGLGVNVVGLDFSNLETLKSLSGGNDVLTVSAQIVGRSKTPVPVPPVLVSLLDATGHAVYEWSVTPRVNDLMSGERATFDTRLSLPPSEAVRVRLSFSGRAPSGVDRGSAAAPPQSGMAESLALPAETVHAAPEAAAHEPAPAEPAHVPEAAPQEHH